LEIEGAERADDLTRSVEQDCRRPPVDRASQLGAMPAVT
jgi:hypothetical protein